MLASVYYNIPKPKGGSAIRLWRLSDGALLSSLEHTGHGRQPPWFASIHPTLGALVHKHDESGSSVLRLGELSTIFINAGADKLVPVQKFEFD